MYINIILFSVVFSRIAPIPTLSPLFPVSVFAIPSCKFLFSVAVPRWKSYKDLTKILNKFLIKILLCFLIKILTRSCKILVKILQDLARFLQDLVRFLTRFLQDLVTILQESYKILVKI